MMSQPEPVRVLLTADEIRQRVRRLAAQIDRDLPAGVEPHLVCVLKGGFIFLADLVRAMRTPATLDFLVVASYGADTRTSGTVRVVRDLQESIVDRHVILVEDIVDTGMTLTRLVELLRERRPRSLRTVCLLDKPARRRVPVTIDYTGFTIDDVFVVGYGLDLCERHRHLPDLAVIDPAPRAERMP